MDTAITRRDEQRLEKVSQRPSIPPRVDIYENSDEVLLIADLPGVTQDDLQIRLENEQLTIEGRRRDEPAASPLSREYRPADYQRSFLVPGGIDSTKISADLKNGVLSLRLPKSEAVKPRRIPVKNR